MRLILLSGGSGKRLWPLSNDARSKQFFKVLENDNGDRESMVQRVWGQLKTVGLAHSAVVATSRSQVDMIQSQLGESVKIVVEPERRDTYPAIALSAAYLYSVEHVSVNEVVAVLPVDAFVDVGFFQRIKELEDALIATEADLALVGVTYLSFRKIWVYRSWGEPRRSPFCQSLSFPRKTHRKTSSGTHHTASTVELRRVRL